MSLEYFEQVSLSAKSRRHKEEEVEILHPVNDRFRIAMHFHTYRLPYLSTYFDEQVAKHVAKWSSRLEVQKESQLFDPMDPMSIFGFFLAFKRACDNNGVHKAVALWMIYVFSKKQQPKLLQHPSS